MKEYSSNGHATDRVIGISDEEARDIRYALSQVAKDGTIDMDVDIDEAKEVLDI